MALKLSFLIICGLLTVQPGALQLAPYPQSPVIRQVKFEWSTHLRLATGSDNWPVTWEADDNQYVAWGDGEASEEALTGEHFPFLLRVKRERLLQ